MSNPEVRCKILGSRIQSLELALNALRRLEHALHVPTERLPHCTLFFKAGNNWRMIRGGQSATWEKKV